MHLQRTGLRLARTIAFAGGLVAIGIFGTWHARAQEPPMRTLHMKAIAVADPIVGGDVAFRMLVPSGWQTQGGIEWNFNLADLAYGRFRVFDPAGHDALEVFPNYTRMWSNQYALTPGTLYGGCVLEPPPASAGDWVASVASQARTAARNLRVANRARLAELERVLSANGAQASAERVRLSYEEGGVSIDEDVYCAITIETSPYGNGTILWRPARLYSYRARQGELDSRQGLVQAMADSVRVELGWFAKYQQVLRMKNDANFAAIAAAGELSRRISANSDAILAMYRGAWEAQQSAYDRVSRGFSEATRSVQSYADPAKSYPVELPAGYRHAWVSAGGEYYLSNDEVDPNTAGTTAWKRLEPAR